jgi:hypothetical protein
MMSLSLPSNIAVRGVTYGTPRVGTPDFAAFFDTKVANFQRINHDHGMHTVQRPRPRY